MPPGDAGAERGYRLHVRELASQTLVVLFGGGEPDSVACDCRGLIAQREHDLSADVDAETTEQRAGSVSERCKRLQDEGVRDRFMRFGREGLSGRRGVLWHVIRIARFGGGPTLSFRIVSV